TKQITRPPPPSAPPLYKRRLLCETNRCHGQQSAVTVAFQFAPPPTPHEALRASLVGLLAIAYLNHRKKTPPNTKTPPQDLENKNRTFETTVDDLHSRRLDTTTQGSTAWHKKRADNCRPPPHHGRSNWLRPR
ncbi:unnamed protein product, partial [Ectocarpus fasciculatus]